MLVTYRIRIFNILHYFCSIVRPYYCVAGALGLNLVLVIVAVVANSRSSVSIIVSMVTNKGSLQEIHRINHQGRLQLQRQMFVESTICSSYIRTYFFLYLGYWCIKDRHNVQLMLTKCKCSNIFNGEFKCIKGVMFLCINAFNH